MQTQLREVLVSCFKCFQARTSAPRGAQVRWQFCDFRFPVAQNCTGPGRPSGTILFLCRKLGALLHRSQDEPSGIGVQNLFASLPQRLAGKLLTGDRTIALVENEILFERGDVGDGCYWLRRGVLKVYIASPEGEERILAVLGPGAIIGELAMIDSLPRSASVQAVRKCELTFVSRTAFTEMLREHPEIYSAVAKTLAARLRQSDEDMVASSFLTVRERVARALLQFAELLGEDAGSGKFLIRHKVTQGDLAAMAGVARESVSRTMAIWRRQNVVVHSAPGGYVVHKATLQREANLKGTLQEP